MSDHHVAQSPDDAVPDDGVANRLVHSEGDLGRLFRLVLPRLVWNWLSLRLQVVDN